MFLPVLSPTLRQNSVWWREQCGGCDSGGGDGVGVWWWWKTGAESNVVGVMVVVMVLGCGGDGGTQVKEGDRRGQETIYNSGCYYVILCPHP